MSIIAKRVGWDVIPGLIDRYFTAIGYRGDGFFCDNVFEGDAYLILNDGATVGFFSLGSSYYRAGGVMFRAFFILPEYRALSIKAFDKLIREFDIDSAFAATNDAHMVSLSFEKMRALGCSFDMQAFAFTYAEPKRPPEFGRETMSLVTDFDQMHELTEGQWDGCFNDRSRYYVLKDGGEILGYGGMYSNPYNKKSVDIGNHVLPEHRRRGAGRSLLINLGKIALEEGYLPVSGCWYYNSASYATLCSAGYLPEGRLFNVHFKP